MKKLLIVLCALMMLALGCASAMAEDTVYTCGEYRYSVLPDGTAEIKGYAGKEKVLTIPSELDGYKVSTIGVAVFQSAAIQEVTISDGIKTIDQFAFNDCSALSYVNIPGSVTVIGDWAFSSCDALVRISIPYGVTSIGEYAFNDCGFSEIIIPGSVQSIGNGAFFGCDSLKNIIIGDGVTSIGKEAFFQATSLTSIVLPDSVASIGEYAFGNCYSLQSINIPKNTHIGMHLFHDCAELYDIRIAADHPTLQMVDGVLFDVAEKRLVRYTNTGSGDSFSYVVPNGICVIDDGAFCRSTWMDTKGNYTNLGSIIIPESVTVIGEEAFSLSLDTLTVIPGSYAEQFAIDHYIYYVLAEKETIVSSEVSAGAWTCLCGAINTGKFCVECGAKKPEPIPAPDAEEGESAPADAFWTCTCGSLNDYNFCPNCGAARPVVEPTCSNCGYDPEGATPNFCPACGTRF